MHRYHRYYMQASGYFQAQEAEWAPEGVRLKYPSCEPNPNSRSILFLKPAPSKFTYIYTAFVNVRFLGSSWLYSHLLLWRRGENAKCRVL